MLSRPQGASRAGWARSPSWAVNPYMLTMRLGELAEAHRVGLLHSAGCTSDGHERAELFGDDIDPRAAVALAAAGDPEEIAAFMDPESRGSADVPMSVRRAALGRHAIPSPRPGSRGAAFTRAGSSRSSPA